MGVRSMSKPRRSVLYAIALVSLTLVAPAAWAEPTNAGGQRVTTSENDTNGDGTVDQRSVFTDTFDKKGRVVRHAEDYDTGADGTFEAHRVATYEYDKSGN